ncbi:MULTISPECIES: hypothetical protein [unclassified Mesorhizobium]|uniref:hypothetical protein n=1 Tax=unclassified Mesorhizobium TaxID=325217 RepID=UPI00333DAA00
MVWPSASYTVEVMKPEAESSLLPAVYCSGAAAVPKSSCTGRYWVQRLAGGIAHAGRGVGQRADRDILAREFAEKCTSLYFRSIYTE